MKARPGVCCCPAGGGRVFSRLCARGAGRCSWPAGGAGCCLQSHRMCVAPAQAGVKKWHRHFLWPSEGGRAYDVVIEALRRKLYFIQARYRLGSRARCCPSGAGLRARCSVPLGNPSIHAPAVDGRNAEAACLINAAAFASLCSPVAVWARPVVGRRRKRGVDVNVVGDIGGGASYTILLCVTTQHVAAISALVFARLR